MSEQICKQLALGDSKTNPKDWPCSHIKAFTLAKFFKRIKRPPLIAYLCLAGICLIWGTTFLMMKMGIKGFPPFLFAALRQFTAGLLLTGYLVFVKKFPFPGIHEMKSLAFGGF